jgi:anti-sigma-K factor RskA
MSANNDDLLYELYVLGVLEEPERSQIEQLLASGSPEAKRKLRQAMETNAMLLGATPLVEPPKTLGRRVRNSVGMESRNWGLLGLWGAVTAGLAVGAIWLGVQTFERGEQVARLDSSLQRALRQNAEANTELARAREVLSFLNSTDTRVVTFGPKDPKPPRGRVLLNPQRGVLLIASNLPPAPAGQIYEMWILKKGQKPEAAGLFQTDTGGNAIHLQTGAVPLDAAVAVTLEPESGSEQPTTTPLFVASL